MIRHYLKIAFRNHTRHKAQSIISLFSLAIAFACVSLAIYWNRYEQTFDSFLHNYDRLYRIGHKVPGKTRVDGTSVLPLHSYLMNYYSEVDKACGISNGWRDDRIVEINNQIVQTGCEEITPEAVDMFDIQWLKGNGNMNSWAENDIAISGLIALQMFGKDSPIGSKITLKKTDGIETENEYRIVAVFETWPKHSNFKFNLLKKISPLEEFKALSFYDVYVLLKSNANPERFLQKLAVDTIRNNFGYEKLYNVLTPLKEVHYIYPEKRRNIRLDDVNLFAMASILLSVCALLNYLTLFISRLRNRGRDMALRAICGSSSWQLGVLLMVEYLLLLLGSLFLSLIVIEIFYSSFVELSQLKIDRLFLYAGCFYLLLFIFALAMVLSLIPIFYFKQNTLKVQMEFTSVPSSKNRFRIVGVSIQLFISLLFIFCESVMIKQIHYLIHADINIERKNIAVISSQLGDDQIMDMLNQIPLITEKVPTNSSLFPPMNVPLLEYEVNVDNEFIVIPAWEVTINRDIAKFYGIRIKEGRESFDIGWDEYFINETFAKQLGNPNPIGMTLSYFGKKGIIRGIVYDYHYQPPTEPVRALVFRKSYDTDRSVYGKYSGMVNKTVAFKYVGNFSECQTAIEKIFEDFVVDNPQISKYNLLDGETIYNSYLTSEFNLLKLLNIITVISLLIALFGVYAQILQECERQRKNIAIRKVYGAQVKDILMMFFKEYMLQVAIAALVAFPIGYVLMKGWLEGYSRQTGVGIEVFLGIFVGMSVLVSLCIGWHVWKAANENPATAVKKE